MKSRFFLPRLSRWVVCLGLLGLVLPSVARGEEPAESKSGEKTVSFHRQIRPIFQQHCQGCHQPAKPQGEYIMTSFADVMKPGKTRKPAIVPAQPEKSELMVQILPDEDGFVSMPKGVDPLPRKDIDLIRRWIAEGAKDDTPAADRVVVDPEHPPVYELPPVITSVDFAPDGSLLAVSGHHEVVLHSADGNQLVARLVGVSERIQSVKFSPDGQFLAVAGGSPSRFGEIQIWHVPTRKLRTSATASHDTLYGVSWSDDGILVAFGCSDNTLRAIDSRNGRQVLYQGAHTDWVLDTVFSKESHFLASVSRDMSMKLTHVETQRFIDNVTSITPGVLKGGLTAVARNPVKRDTKVTNTEKGTDQSDKWYDELLVGGADGVPRLFQMHRTKKRVIGDDSNKIRDYSAMPGRIFALDFSPDGSRFAAGSSDSGTGEVRIYQTNDGKVLAKVTDTGPVYALAYRPDGKQIAVGGFDGNVRLIDAETGKVVKTFVPVPLSR